MINVTLAHQCFGNALNITISIIKKSYLVIYSFSLPEKELSPAFPPAARRKKKPTFSLAVLLSYSEAA